MATAISRPRARARFLLLLCWRRRLSALSRRRRLRAKFYQDVSPCDFFNFGPSPSPLLPCNLFSRRGFSRPTPRCPVHLPSPGRIWCLLAGSSPSSRFPRRYCTVLLYCTVLYASFDVMVVGTKSPTCGFNCQCTADAIGYVVMITARRDSLPYSQSFPRFGSTPAGRQPGSSRVPGKYTLSQLSQLSTLSAVNQCVGRSR